MKRVCDVAHIPVPRRRSCPPLLPPKAAAALPFPQGPPTPKDNCERRAGVGQVTVGARGGAGREQSILDSTVAWP